MSDLIKHKTTGNGLMSLTFGDDSFPLTPFAQEIELLNTEVAGTRYHQAAEHLDVLGPGVELTLRRQPSNEHDSLAVEVLSSDAIMLGYLPRNKNEPIARLMDAGKMLLARVERVSVSDTLQSGYDPGPTLKITVFMREL